MSLFLRRLRPFFHRSPYLLPILLFMVALLPRLAALGQYITPDELNWVQRSVLFHQALAQGKWAETLTTGHPGVSTTWLGAAGIQVQLWLRPSDYAAYEWITHLAWLAPENTAAFPQLATFLSAGRIAVATANSLGLVFIFWLARRLAGFWPAAAFAIVLALDPFVAGLSGLLHVDGLMTTFTTISLLALALVFADEFTDLQPTTMNERDTDEHRVHRFISAFIYVHLRPIHIGEKYGWRLTAVSGAAAGCAILTKSAALTLLPFVALIFGIAWIVRRRLWLRLVQFGLVWLFATLLVQFLLLPALWVSPLDTYQTIISTIFHETEEVLPQTFFAGFYRQVHGPDFYLAALLYRLNPLVFMGLLLGVWFGVRRKWAEDWWQRPYLWLAITWPIFFVVVLCLATKKYDRYLLPALPMLFLLGMLGWGLLLRQRPSWKRPVAFGGMVVVLAYLGTAVPYLLNAYNPILARPFPTEKILPIGWGEAVSASAQWLAEQPNAAEKTAVAGIAPAFAPFFPGKMLLGDGDNRQEADYVVETRSGYQANNFRVVPGSDLRLLHTIRFDNQEQAWIYANDAPIEPNIVWQEQGVRFSDQVRLLTVGTVVRDAQLDVFGQWQLVQPTDGRFSVQIRLLDENGQEWSQLEMPLLNEVYFYPEHWQPDEQPVWHYPLALPPGLPPAVYQIEMSLFAAQSSAQLPVLAADGRFAGVVQSVAELELMPPPLLQAESLDLAREPQPLLDGKLLFLGQADLPDNVLTADRFSLDLFWQGTADLPKHLQLQFRAGAMPLEVLSLSRLPSGAWQPGQVIHEKYQLAVPAMFPTGEYDLRLELLDGNGRPLDSPGISLGKLNIASPDRLFTLPDDIGQPLALQFGDLASLHGYDLLTPSISPGEPIHMTLYWQVEQQPRQIVSTFVHVLGPDGQIVVQGDQWPGGLPSNTWAAGQVIIDEYVVNLPAEAPVGMYQIVVGLYMPDSGVRLSIFTEGDQTLPDDQFVLPLSLEVVAR